MDKRIIFAFAASLGACASSTAERRPAATAQSEPAPHRARAAQETRTTQDDVRPVEVAPVGSGVAPARIASPDDRDRNVTDRNVADRDARDRAVTDRDVRDRDVADRNGPDRNGRATPSVTDQSNSDSDLANARKIRDAVTSDDSLSSAAKNSQIISNGGEVTLRGKVQTAKEKAAIEKYARQVAGATHVHNELTVEK